MKGIVLAGGEGTRLRPITLEIPKPLITIKKKPLINYNLELFGRYGVDDVKIIIKPADRKDYDRWYKEYKDALSTMNIEIVEEPEPMGTFGYILRDLNEWMGEETIFVTNGDDIKSIDLKTMVDFHKNHNAFVTVALMNMENAKEYGRVVIKEEKIIQFIEKDLQHESTLVSAGMYIISPDAIKIAKSVISLAQKIVMVERDLFPMLAQTGKLVGFVCEGIFFDCGTLERWERAMKEL